MESLNNFFNRFKKKEPVKKKPKITLHAHGWSADVRERLEELISAESGNEQPVVLDLDNTILCRDIGEATFAMMEKDGTIDLNSVPKDLAPDFIEKDTLISLKPPLSLLQYYHHLTQATVHHSLDTAIEMIGYNWAVLVMQGLTPQDIIKSTQKAFDGGSGKTELYKENIDISGGFLRPFFYPQMVELIGVLLKHNYDVWVISSSNSWSVRWMLLKALNEQLKNLDFDKLLLPTRVMGISTLLKGPDSKLYKDGFLVWENPKYAELDPLVLSKYVLSALVVPPVTASYGKVAEIMQWIGRPPYIVAGDSFGDIPMLQYAQNRLWLARLEHPQIQEYVAPLTIRKQEQHTWMIQPTLYKQSPGFIQNAADLNERKTEDFQKVLKSMEIFDSYHLLKAFWS